MKYMIIMEGSQQHYDAMSGKETDVPTWKSEELQAMGQFMNELNDDLRARGEWVDGQGLAEPALARRVQVVDGETVVTDGPYAETKEVLAGFWIVDVESLDRATEIAAHVTTCPGPGGNVDGMPVDIRPIGVGPEITER
ncbi:MAG: YciI family protein [Actinomycetota bacterium]|nr:YciI family protein [Actinomycetota bacterium]